MKEVACLIIVFGLLIQVQNLVTIPTFQLTNKYIETGRCAFIQELPHLILLLTMGTLLWPLLLQRHLALLLIEHIRLIESKFLCRRSTFRYKPMGSWIRLWIGAQSTRQACIFAWFRRIWTNCKPWRQGILSLTPDSAKLNCGLSINIVLVQFLSTARPLFQITMGYLQSIWQGQSAPFWL